LPHEPPCLATSGASVRGYEDLDQH
jgi:hypothetical protein